jgi:tetratricopeptide (TPR) repeat protein
MSTRRPDLHRFRDGDDARQKNQARLEASRTLARQGNLDDARRLLRSVVQSEPGCVEAWLGLAWLTSDGREREQLLRRVLDLEPDHAQAQGELDRLRRGSGSSEGVARANPVWTRRWVLGLLVLAAAFLLAILLAWGPVSSSFSWLLPTPTPTVTPSPPLTPEEIAARFVPQLQAALDGEAWDRALEIVAIMGGVNPSGEEVQQWALAVHMQYGQALVQAGQVAQAQVQFDQAVAVEPDDAQVRLWQQTTEIYLAGQQAFDAGDWDAAIHAFAHAYKQMPAYGDLFDRLLGLYRQKEQAAIEDGDWPTAIDVLTQAYELLSQAPEVADLLSSAYREQAQAALDDGKLTVAVDSLTAAHEQLPDDQAVVELLVTAYRERATSREKNHKLEKARADLEAALELRPDDTEMQAHLDQVMARLFPPKRIEIDISKQRFYAWEGDELVYKFRTSTGLRGRDTATGHFEVLSKIPMAYSSIWRLKMPYWLGIYYVGRVENGIHALPIRPDGSVMWGGLLGQRASYGCVILSTKAAKTIYNWAEIGTPVDIHY